MVVRAASEGLVGSVTDDSPNNNGVFNINSFISDIRNRGVVKTNSFLVNITCPMILRNKWPDARNIIIRCDSAALPAVNFQMGELFRHGYGPQESSPHNVQFEPVNLSFILDANAEIYSFWYDWMNGIINFNRSSGLNQADSRQKMTYEMAYKDEYATEIKILMYNESADAILQTTLMNAYPMGIPESALNWASTNELFRLNIPISYLDFYTQTSFSDLSRNVNSFLLDTLPISQINKNSVRDSFRLIGQSILKNSKLDRLVADILLK